MQTNSSIAEQIFKNIPFTKEEMELVSSKFEKIMLKKGDVLLHPGAYATNQYYVFSGCLRSFFINDLGKDHTTQFAVHDWWISDYISFFTYEKAVMSIECIQDAELFKISKDNMDMLCSKIPAIENFFRKKLERAFAGFQKRILEYLSLPAKERYLKFILQYPEIEKNVKNYHIASYLGVTTESLSRIRKEI